MLKADDIRSLLLSLLEDSGAGWKEESGLVRTRLKREGMCWELACRCLDGELLAYGRYPFRVQEGFLAECSRINSRLTEGALFLPQDGHPVFRTSARLYDLCDARERIAHAVEYNASAVARFWGDAARYGPAF